MKKIITAFIAVIISLICCFSAFSASGINNYEQQLLDYLSKARTYGNASLKIPANYITAAKNYFMRDEIDTTKEQYDAVVAYIRDAEVVVEKNIITDNTNGKSISDILPEDAFARVMDDVNAALAVYNLKATIIMAKPGSISEIKIVDVNGETVFDGNTIKFTGDIERTETNTLVFVAAGSLIVLGAVAFVLNRKIGLAR